MARQCICRSSEALYLARHAPEYCLKLMNLPLIQIGRFGWPLAKRFLVDVPSAALQRSQQSFQYKMNAIFDPVPRLLLASLERRFANVSTPNDLKSRSCTCLGICPPLNKCSLPHALHAHALARVVTLRECFPQFSCLTKACCLSDTVLITLD